MAVPGLELADLGAVRSTADALIRTLGEANLDLDLVVASAGYVPVGDTTLSAANGGWESGFGSMHLGHMALIDWLDEGKALAPAPRVVMVSSAASGVGRFHPSLHTGADGEGDLRGEHTVGCGSSTPVCPRWAPVEGCPAVRLSKRFNWGSYARAKLANVLYARELHKRKGWAVASVHPGTVHTNLAKQMSPSLPIEALEMAKDLFMKTMLRSADESAAVVLSAADPERAKGGYLNGRGIVVAEDLMPDQSVDDETAARLWDVSETQIYEWVAANPTKGFSKVPARN